MTGSEIADRRGGRIDDTAERAEGALPLLCASGTSGGVGQAKSPLGFECWSCSGNGSPKHALIQRDIIAAAR